jgi:thiol-disulfide isomerase/thioredoxin
MFIEAPTFHNQSQSPMLISFSKSIFYLPATFEIQLMKHLSFCLFFFASIVALAQDAPAPEYLTTQDFPDSVKSLGLQTLEGRKVTFGQMLETYKGKKIVIDIWGSWCRDCILGYPKLEALRKEAGDKNVVYVFLSTDKEIAKWKNAIGRFQIRGEHYLLEGAWNNPLSNYIVLDWVPRYFVLDETGKIILPKAVHADDPGIKTALLSSDK